MFDLSGEIYFVVRKCIVNFLKKKHSLINEHLLYNLLSRFVRPFTAYQVMDVWRFYLKIIEDLCGVKRLFSSYKVKYIYTYLNCTKMFRNERQF